jgi:dTDP-4-amino-4,6-dideoxygalactose transaminase
MAGSDLAVWRVPLADVDIGEEHASAADAVVRSGWWSQGPRVEEFEQAFARFCGTRHAIAVANGTAALHLALTAAGCGPGDEVVVPSLNFVAAANTIVQTGARPVFCDVRGGVDLNAGAAELEAGVGPATKAVLVLHYGGFACDMAPVLALAEQRSLVVIEDAAHAPGSTWRDRRCGAIGQLGCFSFFSNKNLATGEGGMVVTDDDALAATVRLHRSHGMTTLTWDRHRGHASSYDVLAAGFNYRLDEIRAAIGLVQLRRLEAENAARREVARTYRDALHGVAGIELAFADRLGEESSAHHLAVAILPVDIQRDAVRERLTEKRIQTSVHYPPIHRFSAYRNSGATLPKLDAVADRLLTIPLFGHMRDEQVQAVIEGVLESVGAVSVTARRR